MRLEREIRVRLNEMCAQADELMDARVTAWEWYEFTRRDV